MQAIWILFPLVALVGLVGFVWLLKVAFSRSGLWGAVVFFLSPIGATIFAVKYWNEAKKPFMVYAGSLAGSFVLLIASVVAVGSATMEAVQQGVAQAEAEAQAERKAAGAAPAQVGTFEIQPSTGNDRALDMAAAAAEAQREMERDSLADTLAALTQPQNDPAPFRRRNQFVPVDEMNGYRGKRFDVLTRDGRTFVGDYVDTRAGKLQFRRSVQAGDMTLHLPPDQIKSLRMVEAPRY